MTQRMLDANRKIVEVAQLKCAKCGKPWGYKTPDGFTLLYPVHDPYCCCGETKP